MKKILTSILALCMVLTMGISSFASTEGDLYVENEDGRLETWSDNILIPGKTYYIYLTDGHKKPSRVRLSADCFSVEDDKSVRLVSSSLDIDKKKTDDGEYAYFAEMKLKNISPESYKEDGYVLIIEKAYCEELGDLTGEISSDAEFDVEYPEGYDITPDLQLFVVEDDEDEFDVEDSDATVKIDSRGVKTKMLISCDTSYDYRFGNNHSDKNLDFYYFNGAEARRPLTVTIPKNGGSYLYEKMSDGTLKDITNAEGDNFVFRTRTLGEYIVSDKPMAASSLPEVTVPDNSGAPFNPGTGARV